MKGFLIFLMKLWFSNNNKKLWILGIFSLIVIDAFIDLSMIFFTHMLKLSSTSKIWSYLIFNGFTSVFK